MDIVNLYVDKKMSIPEISKMTGIALSTIRFALKRKGVLRTRTEAVQLSGKTGKLGGGNRGRTWVMSQETKDKLSKTKLANWEKKAVGFSLKPNGYIEYTRGQHKGRSVHVVMMEEKIGRRLFNNECVHHIDENKTNNEMSNLRLMTKVDHAKLHALDKVKNRKRNKNGQFE